MMYDSPIKLNEIVTHISEGIAKATDEYVFAQVNMAVDVDKEELIKALSYDRNQYQKGYADGYADAKAERKTGKWIHGKELSREMIGDCVTAIIYDGWKCSECGCLVEEEREPLYKYCPNCGAEMEEGGQE